MPKEPYFSISCRATSIALAPSTPVRKRIAISSASFSAIAPRAANFSRGRSSFGISRIFSCAIFRLRGKPAGPAKNSTAQLFEQFLQGLAQAEKGVETTIRGKRREFGLGGANQLRCGVDRGAKRVVGR